MIGLKQRWAAGFLGANIFLIAIPVQGAVIYSYIAQPSSVTIQDDGSTTNIELYLQESLTDNSSSLLSKQGGLFNAGVSISIVSGNAASIALGANDPAFAGPDFKSVAASPASFLEGVAITDISGPTPVFNGSIGLIPLGSIAISAHALGTTTFSIGEFDALGGNTLDFAGDDLDMDSASPAYFGAGDQNTLLAVTSIPEPWECLSTFASLAFFYASRRRSRKHQGIRNSQQTNREPFTRCLADSLESRLFLSTSPLTIPGQFAAAPTFINMGLVAGSGIHSAASGTTLSPPFNVSEIRQAYGVSSISYSGQAGDGSGQTIAIIDVENDPSIVNDANFFSSQEGLPTFNVSGGPTLKVLNENGQNSLPANAAPGTWDVEESLDVEWAHAIAPRANIDFFEATSAGLNDLMTAVNTARNSPGVDVVSMSWGGTEFFGEQVFDSYFTTPSGHQGVTFLASSGDSGGSPQFPATSPNIIGVGGTSLTINSNGSYGSESAWSGGGGGISYYQSQPTYQSGAVNGISSTYRTTPDVAAVADPNTAVLLWDSNISSTYFLQVGGTSLSAPIWAGLVAITDQGRSLMGLGSLDGETATLPRLYQLPASDFNDVTTGSNGFSATAGYDLATGLGTPVANLLVPALAGYVPASHLIFAGGLSSNVTAGFAIPSFSINIEDPSGNIVTTNSSQITVSIYSGPTGAILQGKAAVTAQNGVATFSNLELTQAGAYRLTASGTGLLPTLSTSFTVLPANASQLIFSAQPMNNYVSNTLAPITVSVEDAYKNIVTTNTSSISLSVFSGPGSLSGTLSATAVNGVATFSSISVPIAGIYTLKASNSSLSVLSNPLTISPDKLVFLQQPSGAVISQAIAPSISVAIESPAGVILTQNNSTITLSINTGPQGVTLGGILTTAANSGIATFSSVSLPTAGDYTLSAIGLNSLTAISSSFTIVNPSSQLAFAPEPTDAIAGVAVSPHIVVDVEDMSGNVIPTDNSRIVLSIISGPQGASLSGATSVYAVNGVATFTSMVFSAAGVYTLAATDGPIIEDSTSISVAAPNYGIQVLEPLTQGDVNGTLIADSSGNLYGLTSGGVNESFQYGTIFKVSPSTLAVTILASFPAPDILPSGTLAIDSSGDLYGVTQFGGTYGYGTIFELPAGSQNIVKLASFTASTGVYPVGGVVVDSSGNLYGTTFDGGYGYGTVFELSKGVSAFKALYEFSEFDGANPYGNLLLDSGGNLWGTTENGGDFDSGTVFKINLATGNFRTVASLAGPNGEHPTGNLIEDANGNVYGTTYQGGSANEGTLFEISGGHLSTLINFTGPNGEYPFAGLAEDANGNLYGTTQEIAGGSGGNGMIYELPAGGNSIVMLGTFNGSNGQWPYGGLTYTASGNLFGVASGGGVANGGAIYELTAPQLIFTTQPGTLPVNTIVAPAVTVKLLAATGSTFSGDNSQIALSISSGPSGGMLTGTTVLPAVDGVATFSNFGFSLPGTYVITATDISESAVPAMTNSIVVMPTLALSSYQINDGAVQRSMDTLVTISFNQPVTLAPGGITIMQRYTTGGSPIQMNFTLNSPDGGMTWNIMFPSYSGSSLPDGVYDLTINSSAVASIATGQILAGNNQTITFARLFGDYDGNGMVNQSDYLVFLNSYGQSSTSQLYNPAFDYDGNGAINGADYLQFKLRFGTSIVY